MSSPTTTAGSVQAPPALKNRGWLPSIVAFAGVFAVVLLYLSYTGLVVFMGDSFLLANRAKHLADQFNLNLNNGLAPLIYPPLYPIVIAFAYRFQDPHFIFRSILMVNAILTASQVFPLRLLIQQYSKVSQKNSIWLAAALALAPSTLPYTAMVLTDVLYCPLVIWLAFFVCRAIERGRKRDFLGAGVTLAISMLTRSAAAVELVAFAIMFIGYCWRNRTSGWTHRLIAGATAFAGFVVPYGTWLVFERLYVKYEGYIPQFELSKVTGIFLHAQRLDLHAAWFTNLLFYYLTAPLSLAGPFVVALCVRKRSLLSRDLVAVFFLSSMLAGAAVASFAPADYWGGPALTWNKYVMPYSVFTLLIAIRYRAYFNRSLFLVSAALMAITVLSSRPTYLGCHFQDALLLFQSAGPVKAPATLLNLTYLTLTVAAGWLWLHDSSFRRPAALVLTGCLWLSTHMAAARYYGDSGDLNITAYRGLAEQAYQKSRTYPASQVYYDPEFAKGDVFSPLRVLFFWPNLDIRPLTRYQLAELRPAPNAHVLYFTIFDLALAPPVGEERGNIKLYDVTGDQLLRAQSKAEGSPMAFEITGGLPQAEVGERDGKRYAVRWLPQVTTFAGTFDGGTSAKALVILELATNGPPRTVKLLVNDEPASETYRVSGNFWGGSSTTARFHAFLKPGPNSLRVTSVEPAGKLSDGREVAFLLIGRVNAVRSQ